MEINGIKYDLIIKKFELYPKDNPEGYAVGFEAIVQNNRSFYKDTLVPLDQTTNSTDDEIITLAWNNIGTSIENRVESLGRVSPYLNNKWIPPDKREHEGISIVGISNFDKIIANIGTPIENLSLPQKANIILEDSRNASVDIDWSSAEYDSSVIGEYSFEGDLINLPSQIVNPNNIKAEIIVEVADLAEYTLTINTDGEGSTNPPEGSYTYIEGTEVALEAIPNNLHMLDEWTGDISSINEETSITMTGNKTVTAVFTEKYTISDVETIESLSADYSTSFEDLSLPETVNYILADEWEVGVNYVVDNKIIYNDSYYKVLQNHTSQSHWTPDSAVSLYEQIDSDPSTDRDIEVSWLKGNYDGNVPNIYTLEAVPILPSDIANPNEIIATMDVVVNEDSSGSGTDELSGSQ